MSEKIVVNKLTKYYGKFKALSNVSFNVNQGEVFGLIGPNGAGKSTTMRSMLNFIFPSNGSITINGLDSKKDYLKIRSLIGYLPGEFTTYENMTGQEYLKHILHLRKIPKKENYVKKLAKRFDLDLSKKAKNLSKGNKQKIGIIQAFCHDPEILILDEPTSALDVLVQENIIKLLINLQEKFNLSYCFISHDLSLIKKLCHRVYVMKDSSIVEEGTAKEIFDEPKHLYTQKLLESSFMS